MNLGLITDDALGQWGDVVHWKTTGVGRYTEELHRGLVAEGMSVELIYAKSPRIPPRDAIRHLVSMPRAVRSKAGRFDVIHASSPITALSFAAISKPKVVTYHDLLPLLCTSASTSVQARLLAPLFLRIGKLADRIIAISSQTRQEMMTHLGIAADRIAVVNYGVSHAFRPTERAEEGRNVVGYVGALDRRKAVHHLIVALHLFRHTYPSTPIRLVICGSRSQEYSNLIDLAGNLGVSEDVEFRGVVVGEELIRAYNSFDILVHPSDWEGFGFPILEAQRCGVPVIIRKHAHIPEEVSTCCLKSTSEEDMADKIYALLTDAALREATIESGLEYSQRFTWESTVQQTLKVYWQAMS